MLKDKILAALKIKFANKGFSAKTLEGLAAELAKTVTEEANIETAISGVEPILTVMQSEIDTRVTTAVNKAKEEKTDKPGEGAADKPGETIVPESGEKTPAWAKTIIDQNKQLTDRLSAIEQGKTIESRKSKLETKLAKVNEKDKGRYLKNFGRMNFETDDEFETFLTEVEEDVKDLVQEDADTNLSNISGTPQRGNSGVSKDKPSEAQLDSVIGIV